MRSPAHTGRLLAVLAVAAAIPAPAAAAAGITTVQTPNPGTTNTLGGLVAFPPTEIWGVGSASSSSYTGCHGRTLTARWNGTAFVEVAEVRPPTPICASVNGVAGTSTSDIWAVGSTNSSRDPHVRHWNGSKWTAGPGATLPVPPSGGRRLRTTGLNAVAAITPGDVWAVGKAQFQDFSRGALIEHWTGTAWQLVPGPTGASEVLNGAAALKSSNVWAVGSKSGTAGAATLTLNWNGSAWTTVPSPNANINSTLRGVAAASATDLWAVGDSIGNASLGSTSRTLIEHGNGTSWTIVPSPNIGAGNNVLTGVAARSASDVWAVGYWDNLAGSIPIRSTLWMHWNGTNWSKVSSPNVGSGDNTLLGVIAPANATDAWAYGGSANGTLVQHYTP
jgi:hypothetical protein